MNRRLEILRTAIPFFEPKIADTLEVVIQMGEIQDLLNGNKERTELSVCGRETSPVDMEGLFQAIRDFCNEKERQMIDMLLSFFQMKRMMDMMQMMDMATKAKESQGGNNMEDMMEFMKSSMPKEQQENFDMLQMVLSMMSS